MWFCLTVAQLIRFSDEDFAKLSNLVKYTKKDASNVIFFALKQYYLSCFGDLKPRVIQKRILTQSKNQVELNNINLKGGD